MISVWNPTGKRTPIGLDIGETGIRAAQLSRAGDRYTVLHTARSDSSAELNAEVPAVDGDAMPQNLVPRLQGCVLHGEFHGRKVVVAVNAPTVECHTLDLPPAVLAGTDDNAQQVVQWEIARLTSQPVDEIEARYWALPSKTAPGPNAIGAAAPSRHVHGLLGACDRAGLRCTCIDAAATALARMGAKLNRWNADDLWGILDLGHAQSRLVLCADAVPVLVRRAGTGGGEWTHRIAESLQFSPKAAEVQKREHGIADRSRGARVGSESGAPQQELSAMLLGAIRNDLTEVASEIKRSYEYALSCYPTSRAAGLILVGGGAAMKNLPEYLEAALGISVQPASAYLNSDACRITYASAKQERFETLALAIGLALRCAA